ncbi:hypothetical protein ABZ798_04900 [Streptomyces sp. NPDC047803]|uniref:hypothetical protein n=1 Tax=unclassified Streptomyces TaxID=2593676 RepID=UPI0033E8C526
MLDFARSHGKPAMVAEAAPQGARTGAGSTSCIFTNSPAPASGQAIWDGWHAGYFDWVNTNKDVIRAAAYINTDWDSQTQWQCSPGAQAGGPGCANGNWGDSRIQANATVLNNFVAEIKKPLWSTGSSGSTDPTDPTGPTDPTDPTDPGDGGGSGTEPYTQSVVTSPATAIRFTPKNFEASFVTVQYRINGGAPQNYFLTYDRATGRWKLPVPSRTAPRSRTPSTTSPRRRPARSRPRS